MEKQVRQMLFFFLCWITKTGKSRLIAISRDTMTDVNVYSDLGNFIGTEKLQLCLAYTYGDGKEKSCENTVRAVSRLFYGMPVAAYAALDLDAIAVLTDAVGGVEVTVTKDLTIQDPSLKEGERKVLTGEQAQWYVRSRLVEEKEATADANSDRIERQKQYLAAFGGKAAEQFRKNPLFLLTLYQKIKDFSVTNLSAAEVTYLGTLLFRGGFQDAGILSIKGEASMGETYAEFHVDEQAMYEMVLDGILSKGRGRIMKNKKLWITAVLLSGMLALPVQAAVISPGSENVRRSTVTKTAVSPKTGEGTGESVALLLACVSASAAVFADRKRKEKTE